MTMAREWQVAWSSLEKLGASITVVNRGEPLGEWLLVSLSGTDATDEVLPQIKNLTALNLKVLDLGGTQVTDSGVEDLASLERLWKLRLTGTRVSNEGVRRLKQALPNCEISK